MNAVQPAKGYPKGEPYADGGPQFECVNQSPLASLCASRNDADRADDGRGSDDTKGR